MYKETVDGLNIDLLKKAHVLKINREEWNRVETQFPLETFGKQGELKALDRSITDGARVARYFPSKNKELSGYKYSIPPLASIKNTIGAGDCVMAYLVHGQLAGKEPSQNFVEALAAGCASCASGGGAKDVFEGRKKWLSQIRRESEK